MYIFLKLKTLVKRNSFVLWKQFLQLVFEMFFLFWDSSCFYKNQFVGFSVYFELYIWGMSKELPHFILCFYVTWVACIRIVLWKVEGKTSVSYY